MFKQDFIEYVEATGFTCVVKQAIIEAYIIGRNSTIKENKYPFNTMFQVEEAIKNGCCPFDIEMAFEMDSKM